MARPATGHGLTRKLASGANRYAILFRSHGDRVYERLGTNAEGWDKGRAQEALKRPARRGQTGDVREVRRRVVTRTVERANERLQESGEAPLAALTPHGLRRSFGSLLYGIGESPPLVMQEMGHTDPALALSIYAHAMRRDEGENERLRGLVERADVAGLVTGDHSERGHIEDAVQLRARNPRRSAE